MWRAVEGKKRESLELAKNLETETRNLALDKTMDVQLQGLGPVVSGLDELERNHVAMARALDATRHDMSLCGIQPVDEGDSIVAAACVVHGQLCLPSGPVG